MKLTDIKGIGPKTEKLYEKLGITSAEDLIHYYPVSYDICLPPVSMGELKEGMVSAVVGTIRSNPSLFTSGRGVAITSLNLRDETGAVRLTWFNMPYIKNRFHPGETYIFRGPVTRGKSGLMIAHPEIYTHAEYEKKLKTMTPIYGLTKGLTAKAISKAVAEALTHVCDDEYLPSSVVMLNGLMGEREAIRSVHFPENDQSLLKARKRLAFDEFFLFIMGLRLLRREEEKATPPTPLVKTWETENIIRALPYRLTKAQEEAWYEIENDMTGKGRMSRLLQGDVGSGKTILAFLALSLTAANGCQGALMAPTEVLARQHFGKLQKMIEEGILPDCHPVLLTGSLKASEKKAVLSAIADGTAKTVIGTHALIQDSVIYKDLALVVTDEQHRFGVRQRRIFSEKNENTRMLVMSATPIPRTMGIAVFGDQSLSILDEKPGDRLPIKSCVVGTTFRKKAWQFIDDQVKKGHQAYVICPMIEESEGLMAENVLDYAASLKKHFPSYRVGLLHGRLKEAEKEAVMTDFAEGRLQILVSTTVVEVGIDVANATVILIENAERFGLAALHQLRGRVGRGEFQSYCIFMTGVDSDEVRDRLSVLSRSNDGMEIARKDFELRGPGDLLGIRQSGEALFTIADVIGDEDMLKAAGDTAAALLADDPGFILPEHGPLKEKMEKYLNEESNIIL